MENNMENHMDNKKMATMVALVLLVLGALYYFTMGKEKMEFSQITSYQECADAGYPIMESYPERCATPDGRTFVRVLDEGEVIIPPPVVDDEVIFCTQDAMQCPDGSWVGRTGPNCEFVCPAN